jgi:hypothetical protein
MWSVTGKLDSFTNTRGGITEFEVKQNETFAPFEILNEAIVLGWVKEKIGAETVVAIENSIGDALEAMKTPKPYMMDVPLPWSK